jgi:hypothetical protein
LPAPDFNIVVKPNDWERSIKIANQSLDPRRAKYLKFFTQLSEAWSKGKRSGLPEAKPMARHFMTFRIGRPGLRYAWTFSWDKIMLELVVELDDERGDRLYDATNSNKVEIEKNIGEALVIEKKEGVKRWKTYVLRHLKGPISTLPEDQYSELIDWCVKTMNNLSIALRKLIDQTTK